MAKTKPAPKAEIGFHGAAEDDVISRIEGGKSISAVATEFGVNRSTLCRWLDADPQRSVRAREARKASAERWDDRAEAEISQAGDQFELSRARELAQHYRWRSSKIDPARYGDKVQVSGDPENPIQHSVTIGPEEAYKRMLSGG